MRCLLVAFLAATLSAVPAAAQSPASTPGAGPGAAPALPPRDLPLAPAERARYVGRYTLADSAGGGALPLRVYEDGVLLGQMRDNTPSRLLHQGRHTFRPADAPDFTLVFTVEGGARGPRATRVAVSGPELALRGARDGGTDIGTGGAAAPGAGASPTAPTDSARLYDELARMDSLLFDAAYVACDAGRATAMLTDDVEFYHDRTGLHRGAEVRADFARLARNCPRAQGVRRELVPGALRVYPVAGYGAVQTGEHRFVGAGGATAARFVHVWRRDPATGAWRASRVLSLDHRPERPAAVAR